MSARRGEATAEVAAVLVDGHEAGAVSVRDRGLHFGDGLFETIACRNGRARFLELHLARLARGCERLGLEFTAWEPLRAEIAALARGEPAILKLILTRGEATARGYAPASAGPTRILLRQPWPAEDPQLAHAGVVVRIATLELGENPRLAGLKHLNRLEQVLARAEWSDPSVQEAVMFSSSGRLVCGTMSNIFILAGERLMTPRLDRCGVQGVMRQVVLREAARAGIGVGECDLGREALAQATEAFLTNARIGIWPVRELAGRSLAVGARTRQLQGLLAPLLMDGADA